MAADTEVRVDISDLDLLDDEVRHARCLRCEPPPLYGAPFTALCGRRAIWAGPPTWPADSFPPHACPACVALFGHPCPGCGAMP